MVWVIAFGELFFGDLWCVVWGYGGMRTHFSLLNPVFLYLPRVVCSPFRVKGQNVCLARRVAGVRFGLFECRLSGCSRCR